MRLELRALSSADARRVDNAVGPAPAEPAHRKAIRCGSAVLVIEGDSPVDAFVFNGPHVSVICRADLLEDRAVNASPAAHAAKLYEEQGDDFAARLRGVFAIILYDRRTNVLKAWTDHFGVEKLVYNDSGRAVTVATDIRGLVSMMEGRPEIDPAAVQQYLQYSSIPTPKTIYRGIAKLAPGSLLVCSPRLTTRVYWDMSYPSKTASKSESAWAKDTHDAIRDAVATTLRGAGESDLGCFLSGGTDSSSVTGLVGRLTGRSPKSFSIGFDDPRYNEIGYARIASKAYNTEHHEYFVKPSDILELIEKAAPAYDEPFGNSSIIPTYYCARLAAESGMKFLLAGDGGDELFGGNSRYVEDKVFQRYGSIPKIIRRGLIEPAISAGKLTGIPLFTKASKYVRRASIAPADRVFSYSLLSSVDPCELFSIDFISKCLGEHPLEPARTHFNGAPAGNDLDRWLYLDLKLIITDNDARKVSTMSRLAGIHTRYPLLEPTLAAFSGAIPADLKVKGSQLRYIFKKAMADILPKEIIAKSKHGFGLPYSVWVGENKPLREFTFDVLGSSACRQRGYFRADLLEWLWERYQSVHRGFYGEMLWIFMMLELWHITQYDKSGTSTPEFALPGTR